MTVSLDFSRPFPLPGYMVVLMELCSYSSINKYIFFILVFSGALVSVVLNILGAVSEAFGGLLREFGLGMALLS